MAARRARSQNRDTAKDIILGLAPSGQGPRQPKEGVAYAPKTEEPKVERVERVIVDRRPDSSAIRQLQNQLEEVKRQNRTLLENEQAARKRLEANQDALQRRMFDADNGMRARDYDELRRQISSVDGKMMSLNNDINGLRSAMDRQMSDLLHINNEMKSRPVVDPSKIASSAQQMDGKVRDLHSQVMLLKQTLDTERHERVKEGNALNSTLQRLQDYIKQQDASRAEVLNNITRKGDLDKEKLTEEARRLNEKIGLITAEVTRNTSESQRKLRDDLFQKCAALEAALKAQNEKSSDNQRDLRRALEERLRSQEEHTETLNKQLLTDRAKQKERFQKVNEALAALEHHLELGNNKMDTIINSEIQTRKVHEKGLLTKITEVEDKLNSYLGNLTKSIDEVKAGKESVKIPSLDVDALRREMEAIAADKNKLSMEGLLKLEEKMTRVQTGLSHDRREISQQIARLEDSDDVNKLQEQLNRLGSVHGDMEKAQEKIRDKVEKQIPKDLNELSAKADNIRHQLNARLDKEEEERFLAIKELQEAFQKLQSKSSSFPSNDPLGPGSSAQIKRDLDECKVAIKKLAESVTTVKNVLDKKISDESKKREADINRLARSVNS
ncbi:unnamed protein product [Cylicocyclus nassatus]|uniref:Uncharacterized protein n=1 Tax=Cylicocyclus nassatus TaxID=53992 RepID=A0AA36HF93_CYLNA|nr:unnamed protein product [Cylicocyclus nassatus]